MANPLPGARAPIAGNLPATPQFYAFLRALERVQSGNASDADIDELKTQIAALQAQIDALPTSTTFPTLRVTSPLYMRGLLQNGFAQIGINLSELNGSADIPMAWVMQ